MSRRELFLRGSLAVVVAAVLVILPHQVAPYTNYQVSLVVVYAVVILGLDLITGHAGQVSLGQAAFFGIGAYAAGIATLAGWPAPAAFAAACVVPSVVGLLVAIPAVRLRGHALAMVTLSLPLVAHQLAKRWDGLTHGSNGMTVPLGDAPAWTGLDRDQWAYYVVLSIAALLFLLTHLMLKGKLGRALSMVRTHEVVGTSMGIAVQRYKVMAFTVAAAYAGAGGFLYLYCARFISPESLDFLLGIMLLTALVVGGLRSLLGVVVAAAFYVYTPVVVGDLDPERTALIYGAVLLLVMVFAPSGLAGVLASASRVMTTVRRRRRTNPRPVDLEAGTGEGLLVADDRATGDVSSKPATSRR